HERDPDREHAQHRDLAGEVDQVGGPEEVVVRGPEAEAEEQEGHGHPQLAPHTAAARGPPVMSAATRSAVRPSRERTPWTRPSRMTTTRSLSPSTSSISELTIRMARPCAARSATWR